MTNTKNLANLAAALDDGTSGQVLQSTGSGGVQFADSTGSGVTVHANQAAMLTDAASADEGTLHYETGTNKLYVKQSSGFYLLASITNATPTIDSFSENTGGAGANNLTAGDTFTLTSGSNTVVTINATDADLETISYSATVTSGTATDVFSSPSFPVTNQSSNVFTLTPVTSGGGTVTIRFDASDGTNVANVSHSFEIAFQITDSHYTSLLLATDGSAGGNSTITYDTGSTTGNSLTVTGDAHAGTFSPYRHGGYSVEFDGATDSIYWSAGSSNYLGQNSAFTLEFWYYLDQVQAYTFLDTYNSSNANTLRIYTTSTHFYVYNGASNILALARTQEAGVWEHFCWTRDASNNHVFYINGQQVGTSTATRNMQTHYWNIGRQAGSFDNEYLDGYIRDFRYVQGSVITPSSGGPTEPLTAVTNTAFLICHLPYIADGSSNGNSITINGSPEIKPIGPYDYNEYDESSNSGSVYFDGTGDYLTLGTGVATAPSGDFTAEAWVYITSDAASSTVFDFGANADYGVKAFWSHTSTHFRMYTSGGAVYIYSNSQTHPINQWHHVAVVRDQGTFKFYVNGVQQGTSTASVTFTQARFDAARVGITSHTYDPLTGYISDFRYNPTTAIYTATDETANVPTSPLSSTGADVHIKGTDAHVIDKSQTGSIKLLDNTASTSVLTSSSTPPYIGAAWANTSAVSFDGTGDRALITGVPDLGDDFTIEAWIYNTVTGDAPIVGGIDNFGTFSGSGYWSFWKNASNKLILYIDGGTYTQSTSTVSLNQWVHVACTRLSGTVYYYIDGTRDSTTVSNSLSLTNPSGLVVGSSPYNNYSYNFNGYIQDLRLTVGKARYTAADESSNIPSAPLKG